MAKIIAQIGIAVVLAALAAAQGPRPPTSPAPAAGGGGGGSCTGNCGWSLSSNYFVTTNSTHRNIYTNGIPSHAYYVNFASGHMTNPGATVCEQFRLMSLPLSPTVGTTHTTSSLGPVGILTTGGFLYNHLDGPESDSSDLALNRLVSLDICAGHPDQGCRYHYHMSPAACVSGWTDCTLVGYLADGFPIYSYCTVNGVQLKSCLHKIAGTAGTDSSHYSFNTTAYNSGACHLDQSNGYCFTDGIRGILSGTCRYGYVLSVDYPFVMPSYHGSTWYGLTTLTSLSGITTQAVSATTAAPTTTTVAVPPPTTGSPTTTSAPTTTVASGSSRGNCASISTSVVIALAALAAFAAM